MNGEQLIGNFSESWITLMLGITRASGNEDQCSQGLGGKVILVQL